VCGRVEVVQRVADTDRRGIVYSGRVKGSKRTSAGIENVDMMLRRREENGKG
jgi:hypothetical protein